MNEMSQYSVLFVEDEKAIRDNYVSYLSKQFKVVYEAQYLTKHHLYEGL
ncbi:MAG: hypothetical protein U9N39_07730 [Campylobacterota bacterium]|nr:hypothetical protein [Campylobacterota bacterium]